MKRTLLCLFVVFLAKGLFGQADAPYFLGIFQENEHITTNLTYDDDLTFGIWNGFTNASDTVEAYSGDTCLYLVHKEGTWNAVGITSQQPLDLSHYLNGYLHLMMKIEPEVQDTFRIGFKSQNGNEYAVFFYGDGNDPYGFVRDGEWHELNIPIQEFDTRDGWLPAEGHPTLEDLQEMRNPFIWNGQNVTVTLDEIWWAEGPYSPGDEWQADPPYYLGIFQEHGLINTNLTYDEDLTFGIWNGFTNASDTVEAYSGDTCLYLVHKEGTWNAVGITSQQPLDFSSYLNGTMHLMMKIEPEVQDTFRIGFKSQNGNEYAIFFYGGENDPYGFMRDGEWHELNIPILEFDTRDGWLPAEGHPTLEDLQEMRNPFIWNGQNVSVYLDEIWWAEGPYSPGDEWQADPPYYLGIFQENADIATNLYYDSDLTFGIWNGFTNASDTVEAYSGDTCLYLVHKEGTWNAVGITSQKPLDFSNYLNGYLHLVMKIEPEVQDTFRIGFKSQNGNEYAVFFYGDGNDPYGFVRDGEWHELKIPILEFDTRDGWLPAEGHPTLEDLQEMRNPFIWNGQNVSVYLDEIWWEEGTYSPSNEWQDDPPYYLGIFQENEFIDVNLDYTDEVTFTIWNGLSNQSDMAEPYDGDTCLYLVHTEGTWNAVGITSQQPLDFSHYLDGYLHLVMKIEPEDQDTFRIGFKSQNGNEYAIFFYGGENDPYGFVRDGEWHELNIPIMEFDTRDGWLPAEGHPTLEDLQEMRNPFIWNAQNVTVYLDEIWYAEGPLAPGSTFVEEEEMVPGPAVFYPNPAMNFVNVQLPEGEKEGHLMIFNMNGQQVRHLQIKNSHSTIPLDDLNSGLYLLQLRSGQKWYTEKLIIR